MSTGGGLAEGSEWVVGFYDLQCRKHLDGHHDSSLPIEIRAYQPLHCT